MRIGVASIMQETNSFAARSCGLENFTVTIGDASRDRVRGTNSEMAGAIAATEAVGATAVPLLHAWALPSGPVEDEAFSSLQSLLQEGLGSAGALDGLILSLHGAMATTARFDADAELIESARLAVGEETPIGVSLDLHANVTDHMVRAADVITGYHTDPHVDMRCAGERVAGQLLGVLGGVLQPVLALEKRPMIVPAESMSTSTGPFGERPMPCRMTVLWTFRSSPSNHGWTFPSWASGCSSQRTTTRLWRMILPLHLRTRCGK
ncbi:MAG: M81 family metallopeptidase [Acidobacteria bacterium]|nr:M81 family metallopeptidase [Acidobacteriota bacterium]